MADFRVVQAKIETGKMRQMLERNNWTDEEIDHLYEMYYAGIEATEVV